jgi:hypothetical protein
VGGQRQATEQQVFTKVAGVGKQDGIKARLSSRVDVGLAVVDEN